MVPTLQLAHRAGQVRPYRPSADANKRVELAVLGPPWRPCGTGQPSQGLARRRPASARAAQEREAAAVAAPADASGSGWETPCRTGSKVVSCLGRVRAARRTIQCRTPLPTYMGDSMLDPVVTERLRGELEAVQAEAGRLRRELASAGCRWPASAITGVEGGNCPPSSQEEGPGCCADAGGVHGPPPEDPQAPTGTAGAAWQDLPRPPPCPALAGAGGMSPTRTPLPALPQGAEVPRGGPQAVLRSPAMQSALGSGWRPAVDTGPPPCPVLGAPAPVWPAAGLPGSPVTLRGAEATAPLGVAGGVRIG